MGKKNKLQRFLDEEAFIVQSECGISLVNAKLQIINAELSMLYGRNVVHSSSNRIKSYEGIVAKLQRKELKNELEIVLDKINDLIGVRLICSYTDEIYQIEEMLCSQKDVKLIKKKDYIINPKESGYRC